MMRFVSCIKAVALITQVKSHWEVLRTQAKVERNFSAMKDMLNEMKL